MGLDDIVVMVGKVTPRDAFAMVAMHAILMSNRDAKADVLLKAVGPASYEYADAMLKEREK